jgi:hypothetical protein
MKKHKAFLLPILFSLFLLLAAGCGDSGVDSDEPQKRKKISEDAAKPEIVLEKFLKAKIDRDLAEMYQYISSADKDVKTLEEFTTRPELKSDPVRDKLVDMITVEVKEVKINGDTATGTVELQIPADLEIYIEMMPSERQKYAGEILKKEKFPMKPVIDQYSLVREENEWKIFLGLKKTERLNKLLKQAEELVPTVGFLLGPVEGKKLAANEEKLHEAEKLYNEALEIDPDNSLVKYHLKLLNEKIQKLETFKIYKDKVTIKNLRAAKSIIGDWGVYGEVKNLGDQSLKKVGIRIYFLDKNKNPVHESSCYPLFITSQSYGKDAEPLKPNYSRTFGCKADNAPSDWAKKVRAEIIDLEFE